MGSRSRYSRSFSKCFANCGRQRGEPSREECKVVTPGQCNRGAGRLGVARRRLQGDWRWMQPPGLPYSKRAIARSQLPLILWVMRFAVALLFLFCDLLPQRITRLRRRVPRAHRHICTIIRTCMYARCATKRVYIPSAEQCVRVTSDRPANFRLFSPRDFFLPSVRPTNDLFSLCFFIHSPPQKVLSLSMRGLERVDLSVFVGNFANPFSWRNIFQTSGHRALPWAARIPVIRLAIKLLRLSCVWCSFLFFR